MTVTTDYLASYSLNFAGGVRVPTLRMRSVPGAVATGSQRIARVETVSICYPVATARGTDSITPNQSWYFNTVKIRLCSAHHRELRGLWLCQRRHVRRYSRRFNLGCR